MDRLSGLLVSVLILAGPQVRTSAEELSSRPKPPARSPGDAATGASSAQSSLPCRVGVPTAIRRKLLELWTASPTFQRQCALLAQADITVAVGVSAVLSPGRRAQSKILKRNGRVFFVSTTLRPDTDLAECLPHELEHVLEQIEGRNLRRDSKAGRGAWPSGTDAYETERARLAGIRAAKEVQDARRPSSAQPVIPRAELQFPPH